MSNQGKLLVLNFALVASLSCMVAALSPALAKEDFFVDTDQIGQHSHDGVVSSNQLLEMGTTTSDSLRLEGDQLMRYGDFDHALLVLQKSLELAPDDMDSRVLYAQVLEKKLMRQKDRDPVLYNFLIKQWLYIGKKADFLDQQTMGMEHVATLTGTSPRRHESPARFLARVLIPEDGSTKVALGGNKKAAAAHNDDDLK